MLFRVVPRARCSRIEESADSELLRLMAKALIRHDDTFNVLRRSTGWVFWVKSGDHSILPMLVDLASKWHEAATKEDIRLSLRVTLLWGDPHEPEGEIVTRICGPQLLDRLSGQLELPKMVTLESSCGPLILQGIFPDLGSYKNYATP